MEEGAEAKVGRVYIGAGCNRIVNNVSWGACGLVAFGSHNAVSIFCPQTAQILTTLPGHKTSVNCTHWLPSSKFAFKARHLERHYLVSGDAEGALILWELSITEKKWKYVFHLPQQHKKGVTCITGIMISQTETIFASTSSDGVVCIWELVLPLTGGECKLSCIDSISIGSKPMVALSLLELSGETGHLILAMGGLDNKIHLYCGKRTEKFTRACELKGHTDWIRNLDFSLPIKNGEKSSVLLASSSQDKGIRIWKLSTRDTLSSSNVLEEISLSSYIEGPMFILGSKTYQISLESLLIGHEDWVYSIQWQPPLNSDQPLTLLSASMDKTMMIWQPERTTGIWMNMVTVGELSHCALGFYGGHWSPNGEAILAHGYGGSFHMWRNVGVDFENWQPQKVPSGHFGSVSDISWARSGEYLLSVGHDQTTRVFAPWYNEYDSKDEGAWHEIARPQVHGHDINCVTIIQGKGNHRFVSGADEKVARVFEAPLSFLKTLNHATLQQSNLAEDDIQVGVQILGANMSALGLSQKPIYVQASNDSRDRNGDGGVDSLETIPDAVPVELTEAPIEDQLMWHTLWPESHKLYGHGNELFSLCCDHRGELVASSCKAQSAAVAEIWLWQVGTWKAVCRLPAHSLTVTQMAFSHDDSFLLSVSRDRHFSIFSIDRTDKDNITYELVTKQEAHKRIIWTCCWNPFGPEFATGSRDKTIKIWAIEEKGSQIKHLATLPPFKSSVMALSWLGLDRSTNTGALAVGMENGLIELWRISRNRDRDPSASVLLRFDPFLCHASAVNRVMWRGSEKSSDSDGVLLASCGADNSVRVFDASFS